MAVACSVYDASLVPGHDSPVETSDGGQGGMAGAGTMSAVVTTGTTAATGSSTSVTGGSTGATGGSGGAGGSGSVATGTGGVATGSGGATGGSAGGGAGTTGATGGSGGSSTVATSTTGTSGRGGASGGGFGGAGGAKVDAGPLDAGCPTPTLCTVKAALIHRYSFNGSGTAVTDSVGNAHGTVVNGLLSGNGDINIRDGADEYVDLPNGIIRSLTNVTIESWFRWDGGGGWQRFFDFGSSDGLENVQGHAVTSLYFTPAGAGPTTTLAAFKRADVEPQFETRAISTRGMTPDVMTHIVVVIDSTNGVMNLYRDGAIDGTVAFQGPLSALNDVNNWLGRSQYLNDPAFQGTIDEFRIYRVALSNSQVQASFAAGPNPPYLN
jgi:hypothetical protein